MRKLEISALKAHIKERPDWGRRLLGQTAQMAVDSAVQNGLRAREEKTKATARFDTTGVPSKTAE
jgi:hypothetical protein